MAQVKVLNKLVSGRGLNVDASDKESEVEE